MSKSRPSHCNSVLFTFKNGRVFFKSQDLSDPANLRAIANNLLLSYIFEEDSLPSTGENIDLELPDRAFLASIPPRDLSNFPITSEDFANFPERNDITPFFWANSKQLAPENFTWNHVTFKACLKAILFITSQESHVKGGKTFLHGFPTDDPVEASIIIKSKNELCSKLIEIPEFHDFITRRGCYALEEILEEAKKKNEAYALQYLKEERSVTCLPFLSLEAIERAYEDLTDQLRNRQYQVLR